MIDGVPYPIPYQGSKRKLAPLILSFVPEIGIERLIEPFAGSAAVSIAALYREKVSYVWINDKNKALIDLWSLIVDRPDYIIEKYAQLWHEQQGQEKTFYFRIRDEFNKTYRPEHFLYLMARCVKASIRYNSRGEFNQSPDNRRKGMRPEILQSHVLRASYLLKNKVCLTSWDYRDVLDFVEPTDLIYLDPPYQGVTKKRNPRYIDQVTLSELVKSLRWLNQRHIRYILSYDGRHGGKIMGEKLPKELELIHFEVPAGRSSQATLLGRNDVTYESIYLSPTLAEHIINKT
jgi:DNA adenine methylase